MTSTKTSKSIEPTFPKLSKLPTTVSELFDALTRTATTSVQQASSASKKTKLQHYSLPWPGFSSWKDARERLKAFENALGNKVVWTAFDENEHNDGPMSLNAYPGRAFIERVTNEGDACLERMAAQHTGPMPSSPSDAAALWFHVVPGALAAGLDDDEALALAKRTVTVRIYAGDNKVDPKDSIIEARDFGIGLTAVEMPNTILSLNRGNKKSKQYLTGKHGQGASSTYQFSDLTLIASRKVGSKSVAFTLVEGVWAKGAKTPTYKYLTIEGKIPEVEAPEKDFEPGTLVRHIGYDADFNDAMGDKSMYGLLMRSLAEPTVPIWLEHYDLKPRPTRRFPSFKGFRRHGRLIRGTVNLLQRAHEYTNNPSKKGGGNLPHIAYRSSEVYNLGKWDYGRREGLGDLGFVNITYWVADPEKSKAEKEDEEEDVTEETASTEATNEKADDASTSEAASAPAKKVVRRKANDVLKNWVDPQNTVIFTLDGQTHAEESKAIVTGSRGANLWAVGQYMVVQIDCNGLDARAKYEMFTSTREHAKDTPIKKLIMEELARRLILDSKLKELNATYTAADIKPPDKNDTIPKLLKQYLKNAGVNFDALTKKIEKWKEIEEEREGGPIKPPKPEPPPIPWQDPPTFIKWRVSNPIVKLYPGQKYSFQFETDAPQKFWDAKDPAKSSIKVFAHGLMYLGAGEMKGGRVRCHFQCPEDAVVGSKALVQVQLAFTHGAAITNDMHVEVVKKPEKKPAPPPKDDDEGDDDEGKKNIVKVKVRKKDFTELEIPVLNPIPVTREQGVWGMLGWDFDPSRVGFSIRTVDSKVQLYYNAEFPPFLELKNTMSKKGLDDVFVKRFEVKLVLHAIFTLNYDYVDEGDFPEDQRKKVRNLLCAAAESLALAAKSEIELEARMKADDAGGSMTVIETPESASTAELVSTPPSAA